jgi:hypothetical protein
VGQQSCGNAVFAYSLPDLSRWDTLRLPDLKLNGKPAIGAIPDWLLRAKRQQHRLRSATPTFNLSARIDIKTMKVVATIQVGEVPSG